MWFRNPVQICIETERLLLRPPQFVDYRSWSDLRRDSADFLRGWEPKWASDHLNSTVFRRRVRWARRSIDEGRAYPLFIFRRRDGALVGAITLDHVRRGPARAATVGYWVGAVFARRGYMAEALTAVRAYVFRELRLSRIEAACLPGNLASRGVLEKCGFKYEGVAQSYLQIDGRWRDHVLYAALRADRRGAAPMR